MAAAGANVACGWLDLTFGRLHAVSTSVVVWWSHATASELQLHGATMIPARFGVGFRIRLHLHRPAATV